MTPDTSIPDLDALPDDSASLRDLVVRLAGLLAKERALSAHYKQRVVELLRRLYGRKSETWDPQQALLTGILADALSQPVAPAPETAPVTVPAHQRKHTPHGRTKDFPDTIRRQEHLIAVPESERLCPLTGKPRPVIGYDIAQKIDYIPAELVINVYKREKLGSVPGAEETGVMTAPAVASVVPRSLLDTGFIAQVIVSKFCDHLPLYRQEQQFKRLGYSISRKTLCDTLMATSVPLTMLTDCVEAHVLSSGTAHHDDTPLDVMLTGKEKGQNIKEARLWVATVPPRDGPWVHFTFAMNRKADTPRQFFETYEGNIVCDAYAGYDGLETPTRHLCGCWVHVRRKFFDAWKIGHHPEANSAMEIIRSLYAIEDQVPPEAVHDPQRLIMRQQQSAPLVERLGAQLQEWQPRVLPAGKLGNAIGYAMNNWTRLRRFLQDPALPLDNNAVEQMIRPVALGRNNWLFLGSEAGGRAAATYMTLIATCKRAGVNPYHYFKDILGRLMDHSSHRLDELLPGKWQPLKA